MYPDKGFDDFYCFDNVQNHILPYKNLFKLVDIPVEEALMMPAIYILSIS